VTRFETPPTSGMLLSCGDALIDFLPAKSADVRDALVPVVGGSCLNVAIGIARLGAPAGFVGGISTDLFGRIIVDHAGVRSHGRRGAALRLLRRRHGRPGMTYRQGSIPFAEADAIHFGSTTLADVRAAGQTLALVEDARGATTISFDPNCRPDLIDDKAEYVRRMDRFAAMPENLASLVPARSAHGPLPIATANRMP
jgi:fructokinase